MGKDKKDGGDELQRGLVQQQRAAAASLAALEKEATADTPLHWLAAGGRMAGERARGDSGKAALTAAEILASAVRQYEVLEEGQTEHVPQEVRRVLTAMLLSLHKDLKGGLHPGHERCCAVLAPALARFPDDRYLADLKRLAPCTW